MRIVRFAASAVGLIVVVSAVVFIGFLGNNGPGIELGALGSPQPPPPPVTQSPEISPGLGLACGRVTLDGLRYSFTAEQWTGMSDVVVTGEVESIDDGHWATADGRAPSVGNGERPTALDEYRVARVHVMAIGKSSVAGGVYAGKPIDIRVIGGVIGCHDFAISGQPELKPGSQLALFLTKKPQPNLSASAFTGLDAVEVWRLSDGVVHAPARDMTVEEFLAITRR